MIYFIIIYAIFILQGHSLQPVTGPLGRRVQPHQEGQLVHPLTSHHKRSATISTTISDTLGGFSYSLAEDDEDSSMTSYLESGGTTRRTTTAGTQSCPGVESSEWNSESEANWTVADACSNLSGGKRHSRIKQTMRDEECEEREKEEGEEGKGLPRHQPNDTLYDYNQRQDQHISR